MQTASRYPWGKGTPRWISLAASNITNAGLAVAVPTRKIWKVLYIFYHYTATVTANARSVSCRVRTGAGVQMWKSPSQAPMAGQAIEMIAGQGFSENNTAIDGLNGAYRWPLPEMLIPATYNVYFDDANDIDPLDQIYYSILVVEYDI